MKKLLILVFSLFFLYSPSVFADDISDIEIEGISIGDSLLDYMTEEDILKEIEVNKDMYLFLNEPNKYNEVFLFSNLKTYDAVSFYLKNNATNKYITNKNTNTNEKYEIFSIRARIDYIEDFDGCLSERIEIVEVLSIMFPDEQKKVSIKKSASDPSGNSITDFVYFEFDSGEEIDIYCLNYEENYRIRNNYSEGLHIAIHTAETKSWLQNGK